MKLKKIAAALIAFAICLVPMPVFAEEADEIVIFHTNDVHGYFQGTDGNIGHDIIGGIYETTKEENAAAYLVSAGDMIQGAYFVNNNRGEAAMEIMNAAGYSAMALGNHEFDYGTDRLLELRSMYDAPAFMTQVGFGGIHWAAPITFEAGGFTVGFFGITTPDTADSSNGGRDLDFGSYDSLVTYANDTAKSLKEDGADVVICVAHMGIFDDGFGTIYDLRDDTADIDLFIDGHSHTPSADLTREEGKPLIVSAGQYAEELGKVTLTPDGNGGFTAVAESITPEKAAAIKLSEGGKAKAAEIKAIIDKWADVAYEKGKEVLTYNEHAMVADRTSLRTSETQIGDFVADAIKAASGADIALMNGGSIRADLPTGDITVENINSILPFVNFILMAEIDGKTLRETLEHSVSDYPAETGGFLQVSGVSFSFNPDAAPGSRISEITVNGTPLDDTAVYKVATNDWISGGGDEYAMLPTVFDETLPLAHPEITSLTDALAWYIGTTPEIPSGSGRITMFTPEASEDVTTVPDTGNVPLYVITIALFAGGAGIAVSKKKR
ncbi:MAG: 5'-nucleotidase C-terminal domain-containing protein [Ruminococcus sp.]|jgi:5'-nucleotidase|nr:5'-nucleotidase C-terminal domain-containing protein [Ruminococcus sp.]